MQTAEKQAEILKDQGNLYFKKERLAAAIEAYTEVFDPFLDFFSFLSCQRSLNGDAIFPLSSSSSHFALPSEIC